METKLHQLLFILLPTLFLFHHANGSSFAEDVIHFNLCSETSENTLYEGVIIGFVLVDADTDEDLTSLTDGMQVRADDIQGRNLNIRLELDDGAVRVLQVDFKLSGPVVINHSERVIPHALLGDIKGDYYGQTFPSGSYTLWAGANDSNTPHYWDELEIHFEIGDFEHALFDFRLIRSESDFVFGPVRNQQQFNSNAPEAISLEARPKTYKIGSVAFKLEGPLSYSRVENVAPFTLFGDLDGDFYGQILPEGSYTLTATPFSQPNKMGEEGESLTIQFSVEDLLSLDLGTFAILADADTGDALISMREDQNYIIDNNEVATENVTIFLSPAYTTKVKSVSLSLSGVLTHQRIENVEPYALFGDNTGDFNGMHLPIGRYFLKAIPYTEMNGQGKRGFTRFFEFEIINSDNLSPMAKNTVLYPNPANSTTLIKMEDNTSVFKTVLLDATGNKVKEYAKSIDSEQPIDVTGLKKGLYFVKIYSGKEQITKKLVVQ